jgi:hypothetical protein
MDAFENCYRSIARQDTGVENPSQTAQNISLKVCPVERPIFHLDHPPGVASHLAPIIGFWTSGLAASHNGLSIRVRVQQS